MNHKHFFLLSLFLFSLFSTLFSVHIPVIWPDEVLFFNPAWELSNNGIMRTSVLKGLIPGMDTHTLWMPPIYIVLLSGVFQIFPNELITARLFSSFISLGSIFIVYRICLNLKFSSRRLIAVLLLLSTDFLFLKFSHTARMESLCLFFALLAFYFLIGRELVNHKPTNGSIFLSGIFLSFSFLSHPFGIVHSIPILFLLFQKDCLTFKNIGLYALAGLIPISVWAIYVIPNWELFIIQFGAQLSRKNELLGKFSWLDKVKIIFSVYKYPILKLSLFIMTLLIIAVKTFKSKDSESKILFFLKRNTSVFLFVWLFTILGFLFISSESWYVFQMVVPFTLLLSAIVEEKKLSFLVFFSINCFYNLFVLIQIPYTNYIVHEIPEKTQKFFEQIDFEIGNRNFIYLQAIPDPYFYLRKKHPNKTLSEFIPGELSGMQSKNPDGTEKVSILKKLGITKENYKIDSDFYKDSIHRQEVFIFYNENLMNDYIKKYLFENSEKFNRKVIYIETPKGSDLKLDAVLYSRK